MRLQPRQVKYLWHLFQVIGLAILFLWLGLITLENFTVNSIKIPISPAPALAGAPVISPSLPLKPNNLLLANPVALTFINAVPSSDGAEVFVSASGINATGSPIVLNIDPGVGGGNHRGGYAMTLSGTTYLATAIGFAPGQDVGNDGDDTMSITTTVGSEVMGTGEINFQRAFVQPSQPEMVSVDNGAFSVEMPNLGTLPTEAYLLVMSTNAPPAPLPNGYGLAGSAYNLSPSGALTESDKLMTLKLGFTPPLPDNSDAHTLAVVGWNKVSQTWDVLEGDLFDNTDHLTLVTKRFGIYALATSPTWRDSFKESSLTGVSDRNNTEWGPGDAIILSSGATSGTVTSIPITPTNAAAWGTLHFSATTSLSTDLTVDVLDGNDKALLTNAGDGADLSGLPLTTSLKLRATLTSTVAGQTPWLREWRVSWRPQERKVYLPLVIKSEL